MKICVISDSHSNLDTLAWLGNKLKSEVDLFIHLGDDSDDASVLEDIGLKVLKVPGIYELYYLPTQNTVRRLVTEVGNLKILLTHTPSGSANDPPGERSPQIIVKEEQVNIVLYGHTHIPKTEEIDSVLWLNPGHLKPDDKRGYPPTYAILEINDNIIQSKIFELVSDKVLYQYETFL